VKISRLIATAGIVAASSAGFGGLAHAAPAANVDSVSCADGALAIVTGDDGLQHQACVASAADAPVVPAGTVSPVVPAGTVSPVVPAGTVSPVVAAGTESPVVPIGTTIHRGLVAPQSTGSAAASNSTSLPQTGAGMGGVAIAAILVGTGSVASLIARRKSS